MFLLTGLTTVTVTGVKTENRLDITNDIQLDQQQTYTYGAAMVPTKNEQLTGQSFTPSMEKISLVKLCLQNWGNPKGEFILSIRDSLYTPDLITTSVSVDEIDYFWLGVWVDFPFDQALDVTPGQTYYLVITPNFEVLDSFNNVQWLGSQRDLYPKGCTWYYNPDSGEWSDTDPLDWFYDFDCCFKIYGAGDNTNKEPVKPATPTGPKTGCIDRSYAYSTCTTDPNGDKVKYGYDWDGDGIVDSYYMGSVGWMEVWYRSGFDVSFTHYEGWQKAGIYKIRVMAIDENGWESEWSDPLFIIITRNEAVNKPFLNLPQNYRGLFSLFQRILKF
jgi:hypothetical protein